MSDVQVPDLAGAEVYTELRERPISPGWWHVLPDGRVFFQPKDDLKRERVRKALHPAEVLRDPTRFKQTTAPEVPVEAPVEKASPPDGNSS